MLDCLNGPDLTTLLVRLQRALTAAADEVAVLSAVAEYLQSMHPLCISMSHLHLDGVGNPVGCTPTHVWIEGRARPDHPLIGTRLPLQGAGIARRWIVSELEPVVVDDIAGEPGAAAALRGLPEPVQALVLLPLYSKRRREWQGALAVYFDAAHAPRPSDICRYRVLISAVAEALAATRTIRALQEALRENEALRARAREFDDKSRSPRSRHADLGEGRLEPA